jgi:hypothetical protein
VVGGIVLKWNLKKYCVRMWTGFIYLRIASSGGILNMAMNITVS